MRQTFYFLIMSLLLLSCNSTKSDSKTANDSLQIVSGSLEKSDNKQETDTFRTSQNCVVFFMPDDQQIEEMQKENSEDDYNEIVADITWYPGVAAEVLDSFKIQNFYVSNQHKIFFVQANGNVISYDKREIEGDMVLFRVDTLPVISSAICFDRDLTLRFFGK